MPRKTLLHVILSVLFFNLYLIVADHHFDWSTIPIEETMRTEKTEENSVGSKGGVNECKPSSSVCSKICLVAVDFLNQIYDDNFFFLD